MLMVQDRRPGRWGEAFCDRGKGMTDQTLRDWIGRSEVAPPDQVTDRLIAAFRATMGRFVAPSEVPLGLHWCLSPPIAPADSLGADGHPAKGGFLPPVPLPRRMWAAGELEFHMPLRPLDWVERRSTILDVVEKSGRSGKLCFVTVGHDLHGPRGLALRERHVIVYRPAATGPAPESPPGDGDAERLWQVPVDPVLLFRYSALTFNGHRIHYDQPYATGVEHYPGLVIHGPLQATLMLNLAAEMLGRVPRRFAFRALAPACGPQDLRVGARRTQTGATLHVRDARGVVTMQAEAHCD